MTSRSPRDVWFWRTIMIVEGMGATLVVAYLIAWISNISGFASISVSLEVFRIGAALMLAGFIIRRLGGPRKEALHGTR